MRHGRYTFNERLSSLEECMILPKTYRSIRMASTPFTGSTLSRSPASTKGHLVDGMLSSTTPSPRGVSPAREKSVYFSDGMMKQSPITPRRPDMSPIPRSHATPSKTQPLPNKPSGLPPLVESEVLALIENLRHKLLRACDELATLKVKAILLSKGSIPLPKCSFSPFLVLFRPHILILCTFTVESL